MKRIRFSFCAALLFICLNVFAQHPYYYTIPDTPKVYTPETVAARMVDGLGFRYFWATEGLTEKDLAYRPTDSSRSSLETLQHIYGLTFILVNTVSKKPTDFGKMKMPGLFTELREQTLQNIKRASDLLKQQSAKLQSLNIDFIGSAGNKSSFPFWNLINGPISDALWHTGQVVSFRRSTGNPIDPDVDVLTGTKN